MAVRTNFTKKDFVDILSKYSLGDYKASTPIIKGTVQTNLLLDTTKGKVIFRYYKNRSKEYVLFETNLIKYLKDKNYPCPGVFRSRRGEYVGVYNNRPFALFEFIQGRHIKHPSEVQWNKFVKSVAELQILTKNYKPAHLKARWNYSPELCEELARKGADKINTKNSKEKFKWVKKELSKLSLPKTLPKGICHCDFDFSNILFKDSRFVALLDFDDTNYTYLTFDLIGLIEHRAWPRNGTVNFGQAKKIIQEYSKHRLLSSREKRHLFDVYKLSILFDCVWFFGRGNVNDFYEKRKVDYLNGLGREVFYRKLFK